VALFRRRQPLHRRLADMAGVSLDTPAQGSSPPGLAAEPPGWSGDARGEAGIHGVPRARRWDAVVTLEAPGLHGDAVHFVALTDRTLVVEEEEPDEALAPLAEAVEAALAPPYRAEAVRRHEDTWAVAASRVALLEVRGLGGDEAELVVTREGRILRVDGTTTLGRSPVLERAGEAQGAEYVVRARRVEGDLWEVEATPL
jgi:hypothetical protein